VRRRTVLFFLVATGCNPPCHGVALTNQLDGGTGTITSAYANADLHASAFSWTDWSPAAGGQTFTVAFDGDPSVSVSLGCSSAKWAALDGPQPVPLSSLSCTVTIVEGIHSDAEPIFHDFDVTSGTLTAAPELDANGNGTLGLTLDIPTTTLSENANDAAMMGSVAVTLTGLHGTTTFGDSGGCGSGCGGGNGLETTGF